MLDVCDFGVEALLAVMVTHQNHVYLIDIRLRNIQHLVQGILAKREYLILINIREIQYFFETLNRLNKRRFADKIVQMLRVVNAYNFFELSLVEEVKLCDIFD